MMEKLSEGVAYTLELVGRETEQGALTEIGIE